MYFFKSISFARGTESEEQIKVRTANAAAEMAYLDKPGFFDVVVVNDELDVAYVALKNALAAAYPQWAVTLKA